MYVKICLKIFLNKYNVPRNEEICRYCTGGTSIICWLT